ncbi:hypothetical protein [Arthrobacter woluwensis]|uniref:hypothetical protein n=1 Tax=Arthrobacter woluwensis TaxID=156980 RepID=UPI0011A09336|nr:hypothetical protein [Arthrobacter woluwensis]
MNRTPKTVSYRRSPRWHQEQVYHDLVRAVRDVIIEGFSNGVADHGEAFYGLIHGIVDGSLNDGEIDPEGLYSCTFIGTYTNRDDLTEALLVELHDNWLVDGRIAGKDVPFPESFLTDKAAVWTELHRCFYLFEGQEGTHAFRRPTPADAAE